MSDKNVDPVVKELTMVLLYLTRFRVSKYSETDFNSWKGYDFDTLDQLDDEEMIFQGMNPHRTKSVHITEAGMGYAKSILKKYGIPDRE